jgi:hypothetical protein
MRNKANSGGRDTTRPSPRPEALTMPPGTRENAPNKANLPGFGRKCLAHGTIVRNKPNSEQIGREPVLSLPKERPTHKETIMRNKAKHGQTGVSGERRVRMPVVRNKANWACRLGAGRVRCVKRTQFALGGPRRPSQEPALSAANGPEALTLPPVRLDKRAKQSQSGRLARYPTISLFHYSSIPARCRLCKTKPIC